MDSCQWAEEHKEQTHKSRHKDRRGTQDKMAAKIDHVSINFC